MGLALAGSFLVPRASPAGSRVLLTRLYDCGSALTTLITSNPNRRTLTLINLGTIHASISGSGMHANATIVADGLFPLHVGSTMELQNFQGGLTCIAEGSVRLGVMEEIE